MNRETIIQMAREAGFPDWWISPPEPERQDGNALDMLARLVAKAVAEEREECAKVCDSEGREWDSDDQVTEKNYAAFCADAIRARGEA